MKLEKLQKLSDCVGVRETGVSRHHGDSIQSPTENHRTIRALYGIERVNGGP